MIPVVIHGTYCVLHPANGRHGVVICGSLGDEALNIHRSLVFLGERLAAAGFPALRVNYYGTGDSAGDDDEPGRFEAWVASIAEAVRWLREEYGVRTISLCGVRIGAALAARAACDVGNIDRLVMLAPITGRRFIRELILHARSEKEIWQSNSQIEEGRWFEAFGLRIDQTTRQSLDQLDIGRLNLPVATRILAVGQTGAPVGRAVWERLRARGVSVTEESSDDLHGMLHDAHASKVPHVAFARAVAWLGDAAPCEDGTVAVDPSILDLGFARESPVHFGPHDMLTGMLCMPARCLEHAPVVLIPSTGASPRWGNARGTVTLARWLAGHGIVSLRMDGEGIGDAAPETGECGEPYSKNGDRDVLAGVAFLAARFDQPILVFGMCSGAYHAFQAALDEPRIRGLALVNMQKFVWQTGESLTVVQRTTFRTTRFYVRNLTSLAIWRRLFAGEINVNGIARALAGRVVRQIAALFDPMIASLRGETQVGMVRRQIAELESRSVPILYVLSGNDPGLDEIAEYFGVGGVRLRRHSNVTFEVLDGVDHTFSAAWARERLRQNLAQYLRQSFGVAIEGPLEPVTAPLDRVDEMPKPAALGIRVVPAGHP